MKPIATSLVMAGLLASAVPAHASLTVPPAVRVVNHCSREIVIAVRYKDIRGGWMTTDFSSVRSRGQHQRIASTDNGVIYIYAETNPRGTRWSGNHNVRVAGKTYPMKELRPNLNRQRNAYTVTLTC
jgi:uncharacterized membrane protein